MLLRFFIFQTIIPFRKALGSSIFYVMEKAPEDVVPPSDAVASLEAGVEIPSLSNKVDIPVLPTWRLVCVCIR
jgi:hypothetical protein